MPRHDLARAGVVHVDGAALALFTGLRRGELFALRWTDLDLAERTLTVRESVYEGVFDTPKTEAGRRRMPLSAGGRSRQGRR